MTDVQAKIPEALAGKVVRKDLVRQVKVGANVPVYVLEYLLGKYCASDDPDSIEAGLRMVNWVIEQDVVRPDQANAVTFKLRNEGEVTVIDKIKVRALESRDWAELTNLGHRYVHIQDSFIKKYPRLLHEGVWAQVDLEYRSGDEDGANRSESKTRPFYVTDVRPIQIGHFDFDEYCRARAEHTTEDWIDLLIRSIGLEPAHFDRRLKLLYLVRLIPFVERNYNLVDLGPRGTGKSFLYREISPYSILISGGQTTVANLFVNLSSGRVGLVGLWDVIAFDEVAGIEFSDKVAVQILKDYMEAGSFSRGRETITAEGSMVFLGNVNQPIEWLLKTSHLFQPMPQALQDMAFLDRLHFYLPGWETPQMQTEFFTEGYGFIVDYMSEAFRALREMNFADAVAKEVSFGTHLNARDARAVTKTTSGLLKLLHPHREWTREELIECLELALEGRRRVKEQLKRMGSFEFYQTSFSYIDNESREEHFVGIPEQGGGQTISPDPLAPGSVYVAELVGGDRVLLARLEVARSPGSGKLRLSGQYPKAARDSVQAGFEYLRGRAAELGIDQILQSEDYQVQVVPILPGDAPTDLGIAAAVALYSLVRDQPVLSALVAMGGMTVTGNIQPVPSLAELLQVAMDNGAKRVLLPIENRRHFLEVPPDVIERVDSVFYGDPLTAAVKAIGIS